MPAVIRMGEKLFKDEFYDDFSPKNNELLSTIRVPKNLLYLTDRLPKPHYESEVRRRNVSQNHAEIDERKNRGPPGNLPDIKKSKHHRNKHKYDTVNNNGEPNVAQSQALPNIGRENRAGRKIDSKQKE